MPLTPSGSQIDNPGGSGSGAVSSVFTRTGAVTAQTGDYTVAQVTGAAPLASPALTGTPTAPTASALTDNTQIATTAYADAAVAVLASETVAAAPPTIRGTGIQASSASSFTVNWPAGTVAGDLAVILVGGGFAVTFPIAGWNLLDNLAGTNWNGSAFYRVLNTADISTGHVVVPMGGTFDAVLAIITFVGPTAGLRYAPATAAAGTNLFDISYNFASQRNSTTAATRTITSPDGYPSQTDLVIYFGSNRTAGNTTVSRGTQKQQTNDGSAASGALYTEVVGAMGGVAPVFSYSSSGGGSTGDYQILAIVKGTF